MLKQIVVSVQFIHYNLDNMPRVDASQINFSKVFDKDHEKTLSDNFCNFGARDSNLLPVD